jgi:hypothetical protein
MHQPDQMRCSRVASSRFFDALPVPIPEDHDLQLSTRCKAGNTAPDSNRYHSLKNLARTTASARARDQIGRLVSSHRQSSPELCPFNGVIILPASHTCPSDVMFFKEHRITSHADLGAAKICKFHAFDSYLMETSVSQPVSRNCSLPSNGRYSSA